MDELGRMVLFVRSLLDQLSDWAAVSPSRSARDVCPREVCLEPDANAGLGRIARSCLRLRRRRDRLFPDGLFADPAWDMLLDLFAAEAESRSISISSACIASAVPPTTALRWIRHLEGLGLVSRYADPFDRRRVFVRLTPDASHKVGEWLRFVVFAGTVTAEMEPS